MKPRTSSLRARLVILSTVQAVLIIALALVIAFLSIPRHDEPPPHRHDAPEIDAPPHLKHRPDAGAPPEGIDGRVWGPQLTLLLMLLVLIAGGYLTASWLLPPLKELRRVTLAFGDGDFKARAEIEREDEIGELAVSFNEMAARIEQMMQAERSLLANISHELRTPLARIRVAVELLEDGGQELAPSLLEDLGTDLIEVESLLDDIFAAARLESVVTSSMEVLSSARDELDAVRLVEDAVRRFNIRHPNREVELDLPKSAQPVRVQVVLLRRALENLMENAHKYTPDPSAPIQLQLVGQPEFGKIEIRVRDRGVGIPEEERKRLFEPFYRGQSATKKSGLGLGLPLVRRIVEAHGGSLELSKASSEGHPEGTLATLSLPTE